jgi:cell pole-organizing protein PopZ
MSSFEKTAGKNLDEILASIRKTLADESVDPQPGRKEPLSPLEASPPASADRNGGKAQSDKIDDDLADLLAGGLTTGAGVASKETPDGATGGDPKDPLWFLRPSGGREPQVGPLPGERASPTVDTVMDGSAVLPPERSSLPPLYVTDKAPGIGEVGAVDNAMTSAPTPGQASPVPTVGSKAAIEAKAAAEERRSPDAIDPGAGASASDQLQSRPAGPAGNPAAGKAPAPFPASEDAEGKPEMWAAAANADMAKPGDERNPAGAAAVARSLEVNSAPEPVKPLAQHPSAVEGKPQALPEAGRPATVAASTVLRSPGVAGPAAVKGAFNPRAAAMNGATAASVRPATASAPVVASAPTIVPASQTQALEQIIEQLLEPLLRRWVEANLPRLVDAAIRAEVARALEKRTENGREADPKR